MYSINNKTLKIVEMKKLRIIGLVCLGALVASAQFSTNALYTKDETGKYITNATIATATVTDNVIAVSGAIWYKPTQTLAYYGDSVVRIAVVKNGITVLDIKDTITRAETNAFMINNDNKAPWFIDHYNMVKALSGLANGIPYLKYKDLSYLQLTASDVITIRVRNGVFPVVWAAPVVTGIKDVDLTNAPVLVSSSLMWGTSTVYLETYSDGSRAKVVRVQ